MQRFLFKTSSSYPTPSTLPPTPSQAVLLSFQMLSMQGQSWEQQYYGLKNLNIDFRQEIWNYLN